MDADVLPERGACLVMCIRHIPGVSYFKLYVFLCCLVNSFTPFCFGLSGIVDKNASLIPTEQLS